MEIMKKVRAVCFLLPLMAFAAAFAEGKLVDGVDFDSPSFIKFKHLGIPEESANIISHFMKKKSGFGPRWTDRRAGPYGVKNGEKAVLIIVTAYARSHSFPFAVIVGNPNEKITDLEVIFNTSAKIKTGAIAEDYDAEVKKYAARYRYQKSRHAAEDLERRMLNNPDFDDPSYETHVLAGSPGRIKSAISEALSGMKIKFEIKDIAEGGQYASPDENGMRGAFIVNTARSGGDSGLYPSMLLKSSSEGGVGEAVLVFSPVNSPFAGALGGILDEKLGLKAPGPAELSKNPKEAGRVSKNGVSQSPDRLDFSGEDFAPQQIPGRVDIICKSLLYALKESLPDGGRKKFRLIFSAIPAAREDLSGRKDFVASKDRGNFYEGFRIIMYDDSEYKKGLSALAVFGEPGSEFGSFDLVLNPALKADPNRLMYVFSERAMYLNATGGGKHIPYRNVIELFEPPELKRRQISGDLSKIEEAVVGACEANGKKGAVAYRLDTDRLPESYLKSAAKNRFEMLPLSYVLITGDTGLITPIAMIRGRKDAEKGRFELVLSPNKYLRMNAGQFFFAVEKRL